MNIRILSAIMVSMSVAALATAQLSFTSQNRSVSATGANGGTPASASASNFDPFIRAVSSTSPAHFVSSASQNSTLDPFLVSAQGIASPGKSGFTGEIGSANSSCSVVFTSLATQPFSLQGSFAFATVSVTGPGVNITLSGTSSSVNQTGTFQAGASYAFQVSSSGSPIIPDPAGNFNLQLRLTSRPLGTAWTYQGIARKDGANITGPTDFEFSLYSLDAAGTQIGSTLAFNALPVSSGVFSQRLDFGPVFDGDAKWLEVRMRFPAGSGSFTTISPRVRLDPTPYALAAATTPWEGVTGVPSNVSDAFSPWQPATGGINYSGGLASVGTITRELSLNAETGLKIGSGGLLAFGNIGDTLGSADNSDFIAFKRINLTPPSGNQSELRLYLGDDATTASNSQDYFTIGTIPGGTWTQTFGFRSDGLASKPGGGAWANISDPRAKHDVKQLTGTLDRLLSLRGYEYFYNDAEVKNGRALPGVQIGLMADEVERVFPDWVSRDRDGMRLVTERATTALVVEALRDLRAEKDQVAAESRMEMQKLREENARLRHRLDRLERLLNESKE